MPFSKEQLRTIVHTSFQAQEQRYGFTLPRAVGTQIVDQLPFEVSQERVTRALGRMDFSTHVYEGALETVEGLVKSGDQVTVWTQGDPRTQLNKIASSGISEIRHDLSRPDRNRLTTYAQVDKFSGLGDLVQSRLDDGAKKVIVVDDKASNIVKVKDSLPEALREHVIPVWINQGRSKDNVPDGYTPESFAQEHATVNDIREITAFKQDDGQTAWLLDFDHTLANTQGARADAFEKITQYLASKQILSILPPITIDGVRLNGNVRNVEELVSGMSGGHVVRVDADNASCVVKHNPDYPHKIAREIQGYKRLADSPLADRMLQPIHSSVEDAVHVLPHFDGVQVREGLKKGTVTLDEASRVMQDLLVLKAGWWSSQEKKPSSGEDMSMQRAEWSDTQHNMSLAVNKLSAMTGVSVPEIWTLPIIHNGQEYPSLISTVGKVSDVLKTPPPYTVLAHGDATGGNIIFNPQTKKWMLLDAEWTGQTDPAEAIVRMIKQVSTTTVTTHSRIESDGSVLHIQVDGNDSTVRALQNFGLSSVRHFGNLLSDPAFQDRARTYLAGSYLRELALTPKRDKTELAPFAILEAVKAISHEK